MKKAKQKRFIVEAIAAVLTVALLAVCLSWCGSALMPARNDSGAVWKDYLAEEKNSVDVLFFGSSIAYCDVIPAEIYRQSGITSFVMAGPEQTPPVTYHYILESCKTQDPTCIFVELTGTFFNWNTSFSLANVCYMPWSANRVQAAAMCEEGILRASLYPLYEFHAQIYPRLASDYVSAQAEDTYLYCGYTKLDEAETGLAVEDRAYPTHTGDDCYARNLSYLQRIAQFGQENDIQVVFYYAPVMAQIPAAERAVLTAALQELENVTVLDMTDQAGQIGIDHETDWYDSLHFNYSGAMKYSGYLAETLQQLGVSPTEGENESLWQERAQYFAQSEE